MSLVLAWAAGVAVAADAPPADAERPKPADAERPKMEQIDPDAPPQPPEEAPAPAPRQPAGSIAILPSVLWWMLVVGWLATTGWAARDDQKADSFDAIWLPVLVFPFFLLALGAWWLPWSAAACGLTAAAWLGSFIAYGRTRDAKLKPDRRVLSATNAFYAVARQLQPLLNRVGIKIDLESRSLADSLPDIKIVAVSPDGKASPESMLAEATALPGFETVRELMQRAVATRAGQMLVEIDQQGAKVRQKIDAMWHPLRQIVKRRQGLKSVDEMEECDPLDREAAADVLAAVRTLCGLPPKPIKRQGGKFQLTVEKKTIPCAVVLESSDSITRLLVDLDVPVPVFKTLGGLGMPDGLAEKVQQALKFEHSLVVVSAPPGHGLTTTFNQVVLTADRLLRDFVILEDAAKPIKEIPNVKPFRWGGPEKLAPVAVLETAMRGYPTAVVVPDLRDKELAVELARLSGEMLVVVGVQAIDAVQAVEKMRALGMPEDVLSRSFHAATCQRLVRMLCPKCAESYPPSADLLAKLKIPAVEGLVFKKAGPRGCVACSGTGYLGRSALCEVAGGPTVAKAIAAKADRATLLKAAVRDGMLPFPKAGMQLVVAGLTSLEEVQRVFKKE